MSGIPKTNRKLWTEHRDACLMEFAAIGYPFEKIAGLLNISRNAAVGRFHRLRQAMGWQAE